MKFYIYRNTTVEAFFSNIEAVFSGYDDISSIPTTVDSYIWLYFLPVRSEMQLLEVEISNLNSSLDLIVNQIPATKTIYIFTLAPLYTVSIETGNFSLQTSVKQFNSRLLSLSQTNRNVKIIDIQSFLSNYPMEQLVDWKYYYLSKTLLNPKLAGDFRNWFAKQLDAVQMKRKKCLVLDLDNTLWGGILGEDGINGIKIGGDYPGNAFLDFQNAILELHKAGIILTICSKNNETDVLEAWDKNPYIRIRQEHLAAWRINWNNKAQNITELIHQLNIGADSVVFIDDNPAERELVKQLLPLVEIPDFPSQPYLLPSFIKTVSEKYFSIYQLTEEDKLKTKQYKENAVREEYQQGFADFSEYLASLEITLKLQQANELTIPRIAQMTQKTNQFNLTTKRYTEADINTFTGQGDWVYNLSVSDRFGDSGISGLIIITIDAEKQQASIDSFLLSCRVLGKGIEDIFIITVLKMLKDAGIKEVYGMYIETPKNGQVSNFYEKTGFALNESNVKNTAVKNYTLNLSDKSFDVNPYYKIIVDEH